MRGPGQVLYLAGIARPTVAVITNVGDRATTFQVRLDFYRDSTQNLIVSDSVPVLGAGAIPPLIEVLSLAPASKLLYGSDLGGLPELYVLSADWARETLGQALEWLVEHDGLTIEDARAIGGSILAENARVLYNLRD